MKPSTSGQLSITVNWIYVLIAGAVILLFFVSLVIQQKASSERELSRDILATLNSIFTGAAVADKTKNTVAAPGLAEFSLYFTCAEQITEFGIKGSTERLQDRITPMFAPLELKTPQLSLWSLPYKLPYKVIDFLMITSENTKYFFIGNDPFIQEFLNESKPDKATGFRINAARADSVAAIDPEGNFQVRVVDFAHILTDGQPVPPSFERMGDGQVTAVSFVTRNSVDYYEKQGTLWRKRTPRPYPLISLGGERDAATYGAIFAGNEQIYWCNMKKTFRRLQLLTEVYAGEGIHLGQAGGKLGELVKYYEVLHPELESTHAECRGNIYAFDDNLVTALMAHQNAVKACLLRDASCVQLLNTASKIQELNDQLRVDCLTIY